MSEENRVTDGSSEPLGADRSDVRDLSERELAHAALSRAEERGFAAEPVGHGVYSVANVITVARLVMVPFFFVVLLSERPNKDILAFVLFATAALTDWVDGAIARRTGTVTVLGSVLDPVVDRALIASGVVGLYLVDRLPLWVVLLLVLRDVYLLSGSAVLERKGLRVPITFVGKVTTAVLLAGFSMLIANLPLVPGLSGESVSLGIYFVYAGLALSIAAAFGYTTLAIRALSAGARRSAT